MFHTIIIFIIAVYFSVFFTSSSSAASIIDVKNYGARSTKSSSENTEIIQACINSMQAGQTLLINGKYQILGLYIDNKNNIRITGKGCLILSGAKPNAYIFELKNNIRNLQIDSLELVGENGKGIAFIGNSKDCEIYLRDHYGANPDLSSAEVETRLRIITDNSSDQKTVYRQTAIGNYSGQSIYNVLFKNLFIHDINVGISLNADLAGEYKNAQVLGNKIYNLPGASSGQGYGIHLAGTNNCTVKRNTIVNASRHSIYHGKTRGDVGSGTLIQNNTISDHRKSVACARVSGATGWIRAAMDVSRSKSVIIEKNTFKACYDTCLYIARDTIQKYSCSNINVTKNKFSDRQNNSPYIVIGEQLASNNYNTEDIMIADNSFKTSSPGYDVLILQGKNIVFSNNTFSRKMISGNICFVCLGNDAYISDSSDIDKITFVGNRYSGSKKYGTVAYFICSKLANGISNVNIKKNSLKSISHLWRCSNDGAIVNPNLVLKR